MPKPALVISGGGARGAYAVGVIDVLVRERRLSFDLVAGTSTGALIAPLALLGEVDDLVRIYTSVDTGDILSRRFLPTAVLFQDALYGTRPLERLIDRELNQTRADALLSSSRQMFLATVDLQRGETVYFFTGPDPAPLDDAHLVRIESREALVQAQLASASIPVVMPPKRVLEHFSPARRAALEAAGLHPRDQFIDGGVREIAPLRVAIYNGATDLYAVVLEPRRFDRQDRKFENVLPILERTVALLTQEVVAGDVATAERVNAALVLIQALKTQMQLVGGLDETTVAEIFDRVADLNPFHDKRLVRLHVMRPEQELELGSREFDPEKMRAAVELGREDARRYFESQPPPVA